MTMDDFFDDRDACPCKGVFDKAKEAWELVKAKDEFAVLEKSEIKGEVHKSVVIKGHVKIGKGSLVEAFCVIEGPTLIGENCIVRSGAWIRPKTIIGNTCVIGHGDEIKNALIFDGAKIGTNAFVGDSVLGKGARIASGVILGNRRFDQKEIVVNYNGKKIPTGSDKFGAVVGEYARLGANLVTNPGTLIGKHSWVVGGVSLSGFIPANKLVKVKQELVIEDKEKIELKRTDAQGKA